MNMNIFTDIIMIYMYSICISLYLQTHFYLRICVYMSCCQPDVVHVFKWVCINVYTYIYIYIYIFINVYVHIHLYVCILEYTKVYIQLYIHKYMDVCASQINVHIYCVDTIIHANMNIYIYTYIYINM
jgi:hypothetical protein